MIALGAALITLAAFALIWVFFETWSKHMAQLSALTDALAQIAPKLDALTGAVNTVVAAHNTVPDDVVATVTTLGASLDALTAKITAAG